MGRCRYVVIPVADEPHNPTLPLALASIRNHSPYIPVLVGHKPAGIDTDHIPTRQTPGRANVFANTDLAVRTACIELNESFILAADDIYWMRPAEPIRWALGDLNPTQPATIYGLRKFATRTILQNLGLPTYDYESHTPLPIEPAPMLEALTIGGDKRSVYGNLTGQPDTIAPDVKIRTARDPIPDTPWISTEGDPRRYPHALELIRSASSGSVTPSSTAR